MTREQEKLVRYESLDDLPSAPPLSEAAKAATEAEIEKWLVEEVVPTLEAVRVGAKTLSADEAWTDIATRIERSLQNTID